MALRDRDIQCVILNNQLVIMETLSRLLHTPGVFSGSYKPDEEPDAFQKLRIRSEATRRALHATNDWY
jgi:hypothetical protein